MKNYHLLIALPHALGLIALLGALSACGFDTPLTPEVPEPSWVTSLKYASMTPTPAPNETLTPVRPRADLRLPDCAPPRTPVPMPARIAPNFPFPPGMKIYKAQTLGANANYVQLVVYAPLNFKDALRYLLDELPRAGYELGRGDQEPGEAESAFSGNGWNGGFRIATIMGCDEMTEWVVVVYRR